MTTAWECISIAHRFFAYRWREEGLAEAEGVAREAKGVPVAAALQRIRAFRKAGRGIRRRRNRIARAPSKSCT